MTDQETKTITADVAAIRADVAKEFRNHGDAGLHPGGDLDWRPARRRAREEPPRR